MLVPQRQHIIHKGASEITRRAILLFLGWGMDATPFLCLEKPGYDIVALYDYTDAPHFPDLSLSGYREIVVVAWSFGVRAAVDFLNTTDLPVTRTIAVNGTPRHIDDMEGIPAGIFKATLDSLSEDSVRKFMRRMFGSATAYKDFESMAPHRDFRSRKAELEVFGACSPSGCTRLWNVVVVGGRDLVFPCTNQLHAWKDAHVEMIAEMPHFPDMQMILNRFVVDKDLVARRFADASSTYDTNAAVQQEAASELWRLTVESINTDRVFGNVLEVGAGSGMLTRMYAGSLKMKSLRLWDLAPLASDAIPDFAECVTCDAEVEAGNLQPGSVDLLLSSSTLQWFHAPDKFLRKAAKSLSSGGSMALMYYAQGTCSELAMAGGISLAYPDLDSIVTMLGACGMKIDHAHKAQITKIFDTPRDALMHLRSTGVNALGRNSRAGAAALSLLRHYPLDSAGRAPLTFVTAYIIATKK